LAKKIYDSMQNRFVFDGRNIDRAQMEASVVYQAIGSNN
jgi:hypothetical protein